MMKLYVQKYRLEANISLQELSNRSGVAKSYLQRIEDGNANPSIKVMCSIAKALDKKIYDLFECD